MLRAASMAQAEFTELIVVQQRLRLVAAWSAAGLRSMMSAAAVVVCKLVAIGALVMETEPTLEGAALVWACFDAAFGARGFFFAGFAVVVVVFYAVLGTGADHVDTAFTSALMPANIWKLG